MSIIVQPTRGGEERAAGRYHFSGGGSDCSIRRIVRRENETTYGAIHGLREPWLDGLKPLAVGAVELRSSPPEGLGLKDDRRSHGPGSKRKLSRRDPLALPTIRGQRLELQPAPGAPNPEDVSSVRKWLGGVPRPWAVDVFSGAGGLSLGLKSAGFAIVAAADRDATALETHRAAMGGLTFLGDLADPSAFLAFLQERGIERVEVVAGGPPCAPFSRAGASKIRNLVNLGKRASRDDRVDLWTSFVGVVEALEPQAVIFENVPDLARWNQGEVLLGILQSLRDHGLTPHVRILESCDYGVAQHRARLFVVAVRAKRFTWPRRRPRVTIDDATSDLPRVPPGQRKLTLSYAGPKTAFQHRARSGVPRGQRSVIHDHITRDVRKDDAEAFKLLKPGQTYRDLPERLQRYRTDIFGDKYKRLRGDDVSRTITAHIARDGYWYIHPHQPRTLSIREAARLQTFPDRVRFAGSPTVQFRQIGNAVPPALARAVGRRVKAALDSTVDQQADPAEQFARRLLDWHQENARDFPWRRTRDPWLVLLAELCLRRTRADQVAETFAVLRRVAATPQATQAKSDRVRELLHRLGLKWRAENVLEVASILVRDFNGQVPQEEGELKSLPGVGDYVSSALRCFAFGQRAVLLDTNTRRIAARVAGRQASSRWETRLDIYRLSGNEGPTAHFNLALLDLGALICRPSRPRCHACPVAELCDTGRRQLKRAGISREAEPGSNHSP